MSMSIIIITFYSPAQHKTNKDEYKNMPEGCQRSKRSLNWPPIKPFIHSFTYLVI